MKNIRLDKYLADMSVGSRAEVKIMIKRGNVAINDNPVKDPGFKVSDQDTVICMGKSVSYVQFEYYMLNKPGNVITATEDKKDKTVMDLIASSRKDLFPLGRLDKDTEGLLLITNDGDLAHSLLSPRKHIPKTYYVELDKNILPEYTEIFKAGVKLEENFTTSPAIFEIISDKSAMLTIYEGKFHQVKRMFEAVDNKVIYLKRVSMGELTLDDSLSPGEYRPLSNDEINLLK